MKVLVLSTDYPRPDGTHERMFVHVRNLYYKKNGINVTVINFACDYDYEIDGIKVITLDTYKKNREKYDILISHASNLRNHYRFIKKYENEFNKIVFYFHGHEVLYLNKSYPQPYKYVKNNIIRNKLFQNIYDFIKISLWKKYYKRLSNKSHFVFVSNWILNRFKENLNLNEEDLNNNVHIINNSIGEKFEKASWDYKKAKRYNFITIRSNLDGSKYGVDLVVKFANENPSQKFLLIGRGKFFDYNEKPQNLTWINKTMNHEEMFSYLDDSECGILLTREDTQGVMTCELAAYGIPVITSDIEVCKEFFSDMKNVEMINHDDDNVDIIKIKNKLLSNVPYKKDKRFFCNKKILEEIELYKNILKSSE